MQIDFVRYKAHIVSIIAYPFRGVHPNILTLVSLLFSVLFFFFFVNGNYAVAFLVLFGSVFDVIDGYVARTSGKVTRFGGFFDSVCDRISDFFILSAFGYAGLVPWGIVTPALLTSFLVSYTRAKGEAVFNGGKKLNQGIFQRAGRFFVVIGGFFLYFFLPGFQIGKVDIFTLVMVLITILNSITIAQRVLGVKNLFQGNN